MGGGDVDNAADALLDHLRQYSLAAVPGAIEIDGEATVPVILGHFQRITEHVDAGAVDQHVDPPVTFDRQFSHRMQILLTRNVSLDRHDIGAFIPPMRRNLFDFFGLDVADDQLGLLGREGRDNRLADALGGAGQQHHFVFQALALGRIGRLWQRKGFSHGSLHHFTCFVFLSVSACN
ncbi:hypothetical protein D3C87_1406490 [compost metagenome]